MNIIIAILAFILTVFLLYSLWYIIRGGRKDAHPTKPKPEKDKKGLNEILGYDFIQIKSIIRAEEEKTSAWESSKSAEGFTTVKMGLSSSKEINDETTYVPSGKIESLKNTQNNDQENYGRNETSQEDDFDRPEQWEMSNYVPFDDNWADNGDIKSVFTEEELNEIIENSGNNYDNEENDEDDNVINDINPDDEDLFFDMRNELKKYGK